MNYKENAFLMFVLDDLANQYEEKGTPIIRLTLGKSELPLHDDIINEMKDAITDYKKYSLVYPAGLPLLKEKLSEYYAKKYNVDVNPYNIIVSVGTSQVFRNLFQICVKQGDKVLLPKPYYSLYKISGLLAEGNISHYDISLNNLKIDFDSFRRNFNENTKIVVINSPGNPLGNIVSQEDIYKIDEIVNGRAIIISDEIYQNVCFDDQGYSVLQLKDLKSKFIVTNAFSKGFRMYSRRVGYTIVPDDFVEKLTVIQHHTLLTVDPIVQFGAAKALDVDHEVDSLRENYKKRRDYTIEKFENLESVSAYPSRGSFYITLNCEKFMKDNDIESSLVLATDIINKKHVATVPGSDFGLNHTLRLSFSSLKYNEGIDRLVSYFSKN